MSGTARFLVAAGSLLAFLAVLLGALAAHALRDRLGAAALDLVDLATRYQLVHAVAILALGLAASRAAPGFVRLGGGLLVFGAAAFCFGLELMALTGERAFAKITPVGGVLLMLGWLWLFVGALRTRAASEPPSGSS